MRTDVIDVLLGHQHADAVVTNGHVVDVHMNAIRRADVAIKAGRVVRVGDVAALCGPGTREIDAAGRYVTPGLIEPHVHAYHSQMNFTEYARTVLRRGTTATAEGSYFAAMLGGVDAVRFFINELRRTPLTVLLVVPALGYLQNRELGIPGQPNSIAPDDLVGMLDWEGCVGIEEPPYFSIADGDPVIARLVAGALERRLRFMGHGAGLTGNALAAYAAAGVSCDHECVDADEAVERVENGIMVAMRQCAIGPNQREVQRAITERGCSTDMFMFCADGTDPLTITHEGYLDGSIRLAIEGGIDPVRAVQMATINPARYYRVDEDLGSIAPGRQADILLVDDLEQFTIASVIVKGEPVIVDGAFVAELERPSYPAFLRDSVRIARPLTAADLRVEVPPDAEWATVRVIGAEALVSDERRLRLPVVDGSVPADVSQDVLKIAMHNRYARDEQPGVAFLQGYGIRRGAMATSYSPLLSDIMALGASDADIALAINTVAELGGGFVVVDDGVVVASLALPLLGLLSEATAADVVDGVGRVSDAIARLGCTIDRPFANFAMTSVLGEIPFVKMSNRGIFAIESRTVLPTVIETGGANRVVS
jgi:adenine deaminase